ncbi:ARM repeat-containing protein [Xylariaceae sp. FL1272]|nr:ARM repeat-containing protein [Xylariaceae sp. FL1272]
MLPGAIDQLFDHIPNEPALQTEVLRRVAQVARNLWESDPNSQELDSLAQKVGDAARDESKRLPLGESGVLEFFCGVISTHELRTALAVQCLRIIGNSCADEDENRERVVASGCIPTIVTLLNHDEILAFVIPVLFNICVDYEPAQKAMYEAGINPELVSLISSDRLENAASFMNYICKILGFVATEEPEANFVHPATPFVLLSLANNQPSPIDLEDFIGQTSVALTYLTRESFQTTFLETPGSIALILEAFQKACWSLETSERGAEDHEQLKQINTAFTTSLADLSAHPLFASAYNLDSTEVQTLQRWISTPSIPLQSAACLMLGNIARSDETCTQLVGQLNIHKPLIATLRDASITDPGLLHSVISFIKNLAIAATNKRLLGDAGLLDAHILPRIWDLDAQPQIQFDAVSLTRLLLVGCLANVRRICAPLSDDPASPAHDRSKLHLLMDLHERSDHEPTQMESARAVLTVCRVLHTASLRSPGASALRGRRSPSPRSTSPQIVTSHPSTSPPGTTPSIRSSSIPSTTRITSPARSWGRGIETFYSNHLMITNAMVSLGTQTKFPVLRSELLFVFALMARTPEGARMVARSMHRFELVAVIQEAITGEKLIPDSYNNLEANSPSSDRSDSPASGRSSPSATAVARLAPSTPASGAGSMPPSGKPHKTMADVDRENALVLVAELLQKCAGDLLPLPRRTFRKLLKEGGQRLLRDRQGQGEESCAGVTVKEEDDWDDEDKELAEAALMWNPLRG